MQLKLDCSVISQINLPVIYSQNLILYKTVNCVCRFDEKFICK
jgi:hypothetical protein